MMELLLLNAMMRVYDNNAEISRRRSQVRLFPEGCKRGGMVLEAPCDSC
jgi:hypothetical protein